MDPSADPRALHPGDPRQLGPYRIEARLGSGGQGVVFQARDPRLARIVALKVLDELSSAGLARLEREARIASQIDHPAFATIFDAGRDGDRAWIAMRFVDGEDLATQIAAAGRGDPPGTVPRIPLSSDRSRPPSSSGTLRRGELDRLLGWFEAAARALQVAHQRRLVHRDIKPGNLMVGRDGGPVVLDFGLARDHDPDPAGTLTAASGVVGTPEYLAPELLATGHGTPDERVDVWGLGVCLFEALTLRRPFDGASWGTLVRRICDQPHPNPRRLQRSVSRDLRAVVDTALEKEPDRRYRSAGEFADDLARVRAGIPTRARPIGPAARVARWCRRHPAWTAAATVLTLLAAANWLALADAATARRERAAAVLRAAGESLDAGRATTMLEDILTADASADADPVELALLRIGAHAARGERAAARRLATSTFGRDPDTHARLELWRGELTPAAEADQGFAAIERALASGRLTPADAAFARAMLADDVATALEHADAGLAADPRHARSLAIRCLLLLQVGRTTEARESARTLVLRRPERPVALALLAAAARRAPGADRRARAALERALAPDAANATLRTSLDAVARFFDTFEIFDRLLDGLVPTLERARSTPEPDAVAATLTALMPMIARRVVEGLDAIRASWDRLPPRAIIAGNDELGTLLTMLADPTTSTAAVEDATVRADSRTPDGVFALLRGMARLRSGAVDRAADDFLAASTARSRFRTRAFARLLAIHALQRSSADPDRAARARPRLDDLTATLGPSDSGPTFAYAIGVATAWLEPTSTLELAETWRRAHPLDPAAWTALAEASLRVGHVFRARDLATTASELAPTDPRPRTVLERAEAALWRR